MTKAVLTLLVLAAYALHQDFWNWSAARPLALGFIPVGLLYHALYTIGAALLMALLVRCAWPAHLEADGQPPAVPPPAAEPRA
jgi:hypothetical protein